MNRQKKLASRVAVLAVLAMAVAASTFAEPRPRHETWRDERGYRDRRGDYGRYYGRYLTGTVLRVDYRRGILMMRDDSSRRVLRVDADRLERRRSRSVDLFDLRRGDRVTLVGDWRRNGMFEAYRIESVRTARRW